MPFHAPVFPRRSALRTFAGACLGAVVLLLQGLGRTQAQSPPPPTAFGPTDFDVVYSDTVSVQYRVTRACLADVANCIGQPGHVSLCQAGQPITGLNCAAGIHRFCLAKAHATGYGVETPQNNGEVDVTCIRTGFASTPLIPHTTLAGQHPACTTAMPSLACGVAADRYCRSEPGFTAGFGPVERNATQAVVSCVRTSATVAYTAPPADVEVLAPGCSLGASEVSTACRQAMHVYCRARGPFRGGFGPRELGSAVDLGCARETLPFAPNADLPPPPLLPVDVLNSRGAFDPVYGLGWSPEVLHNRLGPARSFSFDGRLYTVRQLVTRLQQTGRFVQFNVQTPEVFTKPLTQRQPAGRDRSFEVEPFADNYDFEVPAEAFHRSATTGPPYPEDTSGFDTASVAICDPHQPPPPALVTSNQQQSVPSRVSNPFACNAAGDGPPAGPLDHDCYDVTIVGVFRRRDIFPARDELWGTPVRVIVGNPKRSMPHSMSNGARPHVSNVIVRGTPVQSPVANEEQTLLEPNITGNGRLLVVQRNGLIQYSVISPSEGAPCDVTQWGRFKDIYQMHTDSEMAGYGIAKYPLRDQEDHLVGSFQTDLERQVRAAYPWVDRDGDNMMFMLGGQTLFYVQPTGNGQGEVRSRYEVVDHPVLGDVDWITTEDGLIPLKPTQPSQLPYVSDGLPRVGLTMVGLWTQGKMFSPDNRNNAVDFGVPGGPWHHRRLQIYQGDPTEVGTSIRTDINSAENQFFFNPNLRPDAPREVVWALSTQYPGVTASRENEHPEAAGGVTDEVEFDDVLDPRALVVSSMSASIKATGANRGHFLDGFVWGPGFVERGLPYEGRGVQQPAHIANSATSVSAAVAGVSPGLMANVQWNVPRFGYLLGGARVEPIAAGGFRGKGLWLDGTDDRLEYIVPPQPSSTAAAMVDAPWFFTLSFEPRSQDPFLRERLLTAPDGTFLDIVGLRTLEYGRGATYASIQLPVALRPTEGHWSTFGIQSVPQGSGSEVRLYVDGYLFSTRVLAVRLFRVQPGLLSIGAPAGGIKGWVDDVKVTSQVPGPEVACNHARGTLVGVSPGDPLDTRAGAYPGSSHTDITALLGNDHPTFPRYACERPKDRPADPWDLADHANYTCLGKTRRVRGTPEGEKCLRDSLLFPEGPLFVDLPRPDSRGNAFCTSCHVNSNPSVTMRRDLALSPGVIAMHQEIRRQPMQNSPKFFGYVPANIFGVLPTSSFATPRDGVFLDPYTTPSHP